MKQFLSAPPKLPKIGAQASLNRMRGGYEKMDTEANAKVARSFRLKTGEPE